MVDTERIETKCVAILQARMSSKRLPGKVLMRINEIPMLELQLSRIKRTKNISKIVVATSHEESDDLIAFLCEKLAIECHRGSLNNVLSRFTSYLRKHKYDSVVRLTADCPLFMPDLCDEMIGEFNKGNYDYYSNTIKPTYPDGLDIEIIRGKALMDLEQMDLTNLEKEHVTLGFHSRTREFKTGNHENKINQSNLRWTVDNMTDFNFISLIYGNFVERESEINFEDVMRFLINNPVVTNYLNRDGKGIKKDLGNN